MKLSQPMPKSLPSTESRLQRRADRLLEDGVERLGQPLARADAIDRRVLHPVGDPEVGDARLAERLAHRGADAPARDAVVDPERPDRRVGVGQRDVVGRLRMREVGRVEVEPDAERLRPVDPAGEVLGTDRVTVDEPCRRTRRSSACRLKRWVPGMSDNASVGVGAQLVRRARLARVVAGRREAAPESGAELLEPLDVVALPAVERNGHRGEAGERRVGVHAGFGVAIPGNRIRAIDTSGHSHYLSLRS